MSCESTPAPKCPDGIPAWVLTFADLMSLLLAFFVLLFSFSEMDVQKYKQVAGSMAEAFGVQREIKIKEPPKGINIIAQEFSAGTPDPKTTANEVRQHTTDDFMNFLKVPKPSAAFVDAISKEKDRLQLALADEIEKGMVEIKIEDRTIVVSILERGSFPSGSEKLIGPFRKVLDKMAVTIGSNPGEINVAGHTDSRPIRTARFRSNWDLSASRAVTVVHALMQEGSIPETRFRAEGYGDTRPVDTNATEDGRARNRRVEVNLVYDESLVSRVGPPEPVKSLPEEQLYFDAAEKKQQARADRKPKAPKPLPPLKRSWADEYSLESMRMKKDLPDTGIISR
ncbi:MAG: OmpA family protein [Gammaproteobacteria bacterium]|nr:OmpA family protein [Gammaproteobacteria bacterium]